MEMNAVVDGLRPCKPLSQLHQVRLKDLTLNSEFMDARGMAVLAYISLEAPPEHYKMQGVVVVELMDGSLMECKRKATLAVINCTTGRSTPKQLRSLFPQGPPIEIAIKEPLIHIAQEHVLLQAFSYDCIDLVRITDGGHLWDSDFLRVRGNLEYKDEQLELARLYYTEAANRARNSIEKGLALSNRAEVCLGLLRYDDAISDADKALEIVDLHEKTLLRKAKALSAVQEHQHALDVTELAIQQSSGPTLAQALKSKCLDMLQQEQDQSFNLENYLLEGVVPEFPDFAGPVQVDKSRGRGRGVFVTKDVSAGDVLFVSNCIAVAPEPAENLMVDLTAMVHQACSGNSRLFAQLNALDSVEVPEMKIYRANTGYMPVAGSFNSIDPIKVPKVLVDHTVVSPGAWRGLWGLPWMVNHSCLPNASFICVGNRVIIFHATKEIRAGQEVLFSYVDPLCGYINHRRELLVYAGVIGCRCKRCRFESKNSVMFKEIEFGAIQAGQTSLKYFNGSGFHTVQMLEERMAAARLSEKHKCWIRGSYICLYIEFGSSLVTLEELLQCMHAVAPGQCMTLVLMFQAASVAQPEELNEQAKELLRKACVAGFGKLGKDVLDVLIHDFMEHPQVILKLILSSRGFEG